jgi:DNA-binding transcriptional ArsR family regulator
MKATIDPFLEGLTVSRQVALKIQILEQLYDTWRTVREVYSTVLGEAVNGSGHRSLSVRLLRYFKAGLLLRRRNGKLYEYTLSEEGCRSLVSLWKEYALLTPPLRWHLRGEPGRREKERTDQRRRIAIDILERDFVNR